MCRATVICAAMPSPAIRTAQTIWTLTAVPAAATATAPNRPSRKVSLPARTVVTRLPATMGRATLTSCRPGATVAAVMAGTAGTREGQRG
jgi:hypothetical protein